MPETVDRGDDKRMAADLFITLLPSARGEVEVEVDVRVGERCSSNRMNCVNV